MVPQFSGMCRILRLNHGDALLNLPNFSINQYLKNKSYDKKHLKLREFIILTRMKTSISSKAF